MRQVIINVYIAGYSISLIALVASLVILCTFRYVIYWILSLWLNSRFLFANRVSFDMNWNRNIKLLLIWQIKLVEGTWSCGNRIIEKNCLFFTVCFEQDRIPWTNFKEVDHLTFDRQNPIRKVPTCFIYGALTSFTWLVRLLTIIK